MLCTYYLCFFFFFNDTAPTEIYTLSLHYALPISPAVAGTFSTFLTDSLSWDGTNQRYLIGPDSWTFGPSSHACHRSEEHTSELQSQSNLVCRLLLEKKNRRHDVNQLALHCRTLNV